MKYPSLGIAIALGALQSLSDAIEILLKHQCRCRTFSALETAVCSRRIRRRFVASPPSFVSHGNQLDRSPLGSELEDHFMESAQGALLDQGPRSGKGTGGKGARRLGKLVLS